MGQKANPIGLRLGVNRTWDSRWFAAKGEYELLLQQDLTIRSMLEKNLRAASIAKIVIERPHKKCRITIHAARPGLIIGKKGADIEKLRQKIIPMTQGDVSLNIVEIRKPELDATIVAQSIAQQLERRVAFRRAMKRAVQSAIRLGAKGIRINCAGRLGGAEIARIEWYREGRVPLHTLRADIDYGRAEADTAYGICGIKVWIFKGEILEHDPQASERRHVEAQETAGARRTTTNNETQNNEAQNSETQNNEIENNKAENNKVVDEQIVSPPATATAEAPETPEAPEATDVPESTETTQTTQENA